jgi:polyribonucleotide nucleotidyltransferase
MFDIQNEVLEWGGKKLTIETGRVARQAHGSVIATYGGTSVLATVVADREEKKGLDFFPLTVNYQEKAYAAAFCNIEQLRVKAPYATCAH